MEKIILCKLDILCFACPFKLYGRGDPVTKPCQYGKIRKGKHKLKGKSRLIFG